MQGLIDQAGATGGPLISRGPCQRLTATPRTQAAPFLNYDGFGGVETKRVSYAAVPIRLPASFLRAAT